MMSLIIVINELEFLKVIKTKINKLNWKNKTQFVSAKPKAFRDKSQSPKYVLA